MKLIKTLSNVWSRKAPRGNLSAGVKVAGETNVPTGKPGSSIAEVSQTTKLTTDVCEQTYRGLLAFNTALEAARAKRTGKGTAAVVPTAGACSASDAHNTQQAAAELARVSAALRKLALVCGNSLDCLSTND